MTPARLISRDALNEMGAVLAARSTLRQIADDFLASDITPDLSKSPGGMGDRRTLLEQHYATLDLTRPEDVRRLLETFTRMLRRLHDEESAFLFDQGPQPTTAALKRALARDGFRWERDRFVGETPRSRMALAGGTHEITEVTRRSIIDELRVGGVSWAGAIEENELVDRLTTEGFGAFDLDDLAGDVWRHRRDHNDWEDDWVFTDTRIALLDTSDQRFLRFLMETVHPVVRPDAEAAAKLVRAYNGHLLADGWALTSGRPISGRPQFVARRVGRAEIAMPEPRLGDVLSAPRVAELIADCDDRLASGKLAASVTSARTLLETVLAELEQRLAGTRSNHGDLPKQYREVAKLLKMDDQRTDLDDRFKELLRGLNQSVNALAAVSNKTSDRHATERPPAPHHARLVVNAAKTVVMFLVESYAWQQAKAERESSSLLTKDVS